MCQLFAPHLNVFSIQQMFCSRITYLIHIIFLYIEEIEYAGKKCCMEETLNMWKKHLAHEVDIYYELIHFISRVNV